MKVLEVCIFAAIDPGVVGKFDSLVATESGRRASSYCLGPGDCARRDNRVQDAGGTDSPGFGDDGVDGGGSGDCGGWHWETEARASLGDVWCRKLSDAVGDGREIVALQRCWEGLGSAKAAGRCSAIPWSDGCVWDLKLYTYTMVRLVIVGRRLLWVVVTVTVVGFVTVVILVLMTLLVGGATASQKAIAKGSPMMSSAMTSTAMHSTVSRISGTSS